jgi:predicted GNAT family N-acyltransferase
MRHFVILAPEHGDVRPFLNVRHSLKAGHRLLHKLQTFRGDCYVRLGALQRDQLHTSGRHVQPQDLEAWHLLSLKKNDELAAGLRLVLVEHPRELRVGGWCVHQQVRGSREAFEILMAAWALAALLNVQWATAVATSSFSKSADILKRIGGQLVRAYHDETYKSPVEEIRFDVSKINPRFEKALEQYKEELRHATVICAPGLRDVAAVPIDEFSDDGSLEPSTALA